MTLLQVIHAIVSAFASLGAAHPAVSHHHGFGLIVTHKFIVPICHIPAHLHGVFHCSGWVSRP